MLPHPRKLAFSLERVYYEIRKEALKSRSYLAVAKKKEIKTDIEALEKGGSISREAGEPQ